MPIHFWLTDSHTRMQSRKSTDDQNNKANLYKMSVNLDSQGLTVHSSIHCPNPSLPRPTK